MYDKLLAIETLKNIENSLREIVEWSHDIVSVEDFTTSPNGMILLNALCMKILAVGEEIKGLDRRTGGELLKQYPTIEWKEVKGMRDIIAHRYFSLDADVIFSVIKVDIHPLLEVIQQMRDDIKKVLKE